MGIGGSMTYYSIMNGRNKRVHPVRRIPLRRMANCTALKDVDP